MPNFRVIVKRGVFDPAVPFVSCVLPCVKSQNAAHAAACGLSLAGGECADEIEVKALQPAPGRSPFTIFRGCSWGVYGFCYTKRFSECCQERGEC